LKIYLKRCCLGSRFGQPSSPQGGQGWGSQSYVQQPQVQQQQHSAQQHEALSAKYVQRTGQPYQAANMPASQTDSPHKRYALLNDLPSPLARRFRGPIIQSTEWASALGSWNACSQSCSPLAGFALQQVL